MAKSLQTTIEHICDHFRQSDDWGQVASYIPELKNVNLRQLAISIVLTDGRSFSCGDCHTPFSIQSVSKVFTLAIALGRVGDQLWKRVGREPSDRMFNSIVQLEYENGRPRNPFVNAGAIVTTDEILSGREPKLALAEIVQFARTAAQDENIHINESVARSELECGNRNLALAHFLASCGNLKNDVDLTIGTYTHHCALQMTSEQLARSGSFLLAPSLNPNLISAQRIRRICALMMTCGHYDGSGEFAYSVGLPAKSGVGGGILAIVPGHASVAVWSPGLNQYGNSKIGTELLSVLAHELNWSVF